jgi:hypothetical protein
MRSLLIEAFLIFFKMQSTITLYDNHESQRERILELFRLQEGILYTYQLVDLHIYQYNARIKELREKGYDIESKKIGGIFGFSMCSIGNEGALKCPKTQQKNAFLTEVIYETRETGKKMFL